MSECRWDDEANDGMAYETECDEVFQFICDGVAENRFVFCPFCGGKIVEVRCE